VFSLELIRGVEDMVVCADEDGVNTVKRTPNVEEELGGL
jgi:hypothetical protein